MEPIFNRTCTAFIDSKKIASGDLKEVATRVKKHLQSHAHSNLLIFDDLTSQPIELDLRGTLEATLKRIEALTPSEEEKKTGPGRPKLGVISKEVTLLPQQWDWLASQPGGASVTLRKLIEDARKKNFAKDQIRQAQDAAYKFMTVMAGDLQDYEEALRAFYAKDHEKFKLMIKSWPKDVRDHTLKLAEKTWS